MTQTFEQDISVQTVAKNETKRNDKRLNWDNNKQLKCEVACGSRHLSSSSTTKLFSEKLN